MRRTTATSNQPGSSWWRQGATVLATLALWNNDVVLADSNQISIDVRNDSGMPLGIYWVHPSTKELSLITNAAMDSTVNLDSFRGHDFRFEENPNPNTGTCIKGNDECLGNVFTVALKGPESLEQWIIHPGLLLEVVGPQGSNNDVAAPIMSPDELLQHCQDEATEALTEKGLSAEDEDKIFQRMESCMQFGLAHALKRAEDEVLFQRELREGVAISMENYTCADPDMESSPDVITRDWISEKDGQSRTVHIKLERPASRIHVIENFASPEECAAMEAVAEPKLLRASTADGKGGTQYSISRKALQAGITPNFDKEAEGDLVAQLSRRVYDYTNVVLDLNITEHGQEPLMSIQYFGKGYNNTEPDRYTPHCDGKCEGKAFLDGGRMATTVIYCTIPEKGGHTNFQNAGVHVKPTAGSAVFFSYIDPITNQSDFGYTQHSGCPVYEGEKKIITQWVRYGVSKEVRHSAFNTLGVLTREDGDR